MSKLYFISARSTTVIIPRPTGVDTDVLTTFCGECAAGSTTCEAHAEASGAVGVTATFFSVIAALFVLV